MQCPDHKEGGEVVLTLVIVRNGLNLMMVPKKIQKMVVI